MGLIFLNIPSVCIPSQFLLSEVVQQSYPIVCVFWTVSSDTFEADTWQTNGDILPTGRGKQLDKFP